MFAAGDIARADILLSPDRIYYRFATDDSIEDDSYRHIKAILPNLSLISYHRCRRTQT